ncbi:MAG: hypothetical protein FLDDKLPJ_00168 [Phycisphaerae bacterium]|nr:hypothetical protein [Phycisphaerae bacterium]
MQLLLITNASTHQYKLDLLDMVCFPEDFHITVSYRFCWVHDGVIGKDCKFWQGKIVLIVYYYPVTYCQTTNKRLDHSIPDGSAHQTGKQSEFVFFPVRYAKIVSTEKHDDSITFELSLLGWYRWGEEREENNKKLEALQSDFRQTCPHRPIPGRPLRTDARGDQKTTLVRFDESDSPWCPFRPGVSASHGNARDRWERFVSFFKHIDGIKKCLFMWLSFVGSPPSRKPSREGDWLSFEIVSSARYRVSIILKKGPNALMRLPLVSVDPNIVRVVGPHRKQRSGGVELLYELVPRSTLVREHGFVEIGFPEIRSAVENAGPHRSQDPNQDEIEDICGPKLCAEVVVLPDRRFYWAVPFFMLGTLEPIPKLDICCLSLQCHHAYTHG